jgi:hypothetical protein
MRETFDFKKSLFSNEQHVRMKQPMKMNKNTTRPTLKVMRPALLPRSQSKSAFRNSASVMFESSTNGSAYWEAVIVYV